MEYDINKGIGAHAEFKGLKAQYLVMFVAGILAVFVIFVILYMAGVGQGACIAVAAILASVIVWLTFHLNSKYGEYGLMKLWAASKRPHYLINRKAVYHLFSHSRK